MSDGNRGGDGDGGGGAAGKRDRGTTGRCGLESVTVQVVVEEAANVVLVHSREVIGGAVTVRAKDLLEPLRVAVMVGFWSEVTAAAVAVKVAEVVAGATVTEAGTVTAEVVLLARATEEPPAGAALERVTVQEVEEEAARVVLVHSKEVGVIGAAVMVRARDLVVPLRVAEMEGFWSEVTAAAVAVKVAEEAAGGDGHGGGDGDGGSVAAGERDGGAGRGRLWKG